MMRTAAALLLLVGGCSIFTDSFEIDEFSGDPFPIEVDTTSGAVLVGVRQAGLADRVGVIDLLSPFTVADSGPGVVPSISYPDLVILGAAGSGGPLTRPRAELQGPQLLALHPCVDAAPCTVGPAATPVPYGVILGADSLAGDDIRLALASDQISIFANVAGDEGGRSAVCDAVLPSPYRGGGTAIVNGTELGYAGRRITIGACVAFAPDPARPQSQRGVDTLFVVSTAIGPSILGVAAYARYRLAEGAVPPALEALPVAAVLLPSGLTSGHVATLPSIAFVGFDQSTSRGPCREQFAHHLLLQHDCLPTDDCPCADGGGNNAGNTFCSVPAIVELAPTAGFPVLVISDADPTLQALRTELRPDQAEVDGILGTSALRTIELDADYPHDRVLLRCDQAAGSDASCVTRPELPDQSSRAAVQACIPSTGSGVIP